MSRSGVADVIHDVAVCEGGIESAGCSRDGALAPPPATLLMIESYSCRRSNATRSQSGKVRDLIACSPIDNGLIQPRRLNQRHVQRTPPAHSRGQSFRPVRRWRRLRPSALRRLPLSRRLPLGLGLDLERACAADRHAFSTCTLRCAHGQTYTAAARASRL